MKRLLQLVLVIAPIIISIISIITLVTTAPLDQRDIPLIDNFAFKQTIFLITGILVFLLLTRVDIDYLRYPLFMGGMYVLSLFLLILVLIAPRSVANTHRWFVIGPFTIQPSELIKPFVYLFMPFILTRKDPSWTRIVELVLFMAPVLFLIFIEPDAGTFIFYFLIMSIIGLVWAVKWRFVLKALAAFVLSLFGLIFANILGLWGLGLLILVILILRLDKQAWVSYLVFLSSSLLIVLAAVAAWRFNILRPYQKERLMPFIEAFEKRGIIGVFNTEREPNPHVRQAKIAIGSAGIFGKGPWQGTQSRLRFLPEYTTDFIYAAFVEEFGLLGGFLLISIYVLLISALFVSAVMQESEYYFLFSLAVMVGLSLQTIINLGMNLGILPTKGMPLPFLSYGGSSLISAYASLGLVYSSLSKMIEYTKPTLSLKKKLV